MAATETGSRAADTADALYRAHAAEVYRYVYAVLGNSADAEDVTQTTFVNALRALERGERPLEPANWLVTIAHNLIRQRFRQQQSRPREVELVADVPAHEADEDTPSLDELVRALQRIPPAQREALVLRELEGRSYGEIAAILDVSQSALETLLFRARRSLAEELESIVTCDRAELALSRLADGRLGRKERRRLAAHVRECPSCARVVALGKRRRRAFKGLAALPLPLSLSLFRDAPAATAAVAGGGGATGLAAAKVAAVVATIAVAGGSGYEGVERLREPVAPAPPPRAQPARAARAVPPASTTVSALRPRETRTPRVPRGRGRAIAKPEPPSSPGGKSASARARVHPSPVRPSTSKPKPARTTAPARGRLRPTRARNPHAPARPHATKRAGKASARARARPAK